MSRIRETKRTIKWNKEGAGWRGVAWRENREDINSGPGAVNKRWITAELCIPVEGESESDRTATQTHQRVRGGHP